MSSISAESARKSPPDPGVCDGNMLRGEMDTKLDGPIPLLPFEVIFGLTALTPAILDEYRGHTTV
jgi:hypothetical protein